MARGYDSTSTNSHENGPDLARKARGVMSIGSLFAGIGGLELGLEWAGVGRTVWQVERDPFCQRVLARHWPDADRFDDVRTVGAHNLAPVDVICGGYPCQPFSQAGRRKGQHDERHLWPEFARILRELRPRFAVLENVSGHLSLGFGDVLGDLAALGYDAEWSCVRASDVGARHRRERVFIVAWLAYARRGGVERRRGSGIMDRASRPGASEGDQWQRDGHAAGDCGAPLADSNGGRCEVIRQPRDANKQRASGHVADGCDGAQCVGDADHARLERRGLLGRKRADERAAGPSSSARIGGGRLNPAWVEQLMGFPPGWTWLDPASPKPNGKRRGSSQARSRTAPTDSGRSATPSSRKSPHSSGEDS